MKKIKFVFLFFLLLITQVPMNSCHAIEYEDEIVENYWHEQLFDKLVDRMYCISETTGEIEDYNAALEKFRQLLTKKLEEGYNPNEQNADGRTPLMLAALLGYPQLIQVLLERPEVKANIDFRDNKGLSALDYAMQASRLSAIFLNPTIMEEPFLFVPFLTLLSYYTYIDQDNYNPYSKSVYLLKSYGAQPNPVPLKERMTLHLNKIIELLTEYSSSDPESGEEKDEKLIQLMIEKVQDNLMKLQKYEEGSDFGKFCIENIEENFQAI